MNHLYRLVAGILPFVLLAICASCRQGAPFNQNPANSLAPASGRYYQTFQKWPTSLQQVQLGATEPEVQVMSTVRNAQFSPQPDGTLIITWTNQNGTHGLLHIQTAPYGQVVILNKQSPM
jgi:hypothetical protein